MLLDNCLLTLWKYVADSYRGGTLDNQAYFGPFTIFVLFLSYFINMLPILTGLYTMDNQASVDLAFYSAM